MTFDLTYEELVSLFHWSLDGPLEDGDIIIPQVAAEHLERHGVPPGDFFREGMRTLDDTDALKFSMGMTLRIRPIIRSGFGWRGRLWRAIQTLPADWMVRDKAVAWFVRQWALEQIPTPETPEFYSRDTKARVFLASAEKHYKGLFGWVDPANKPLILEVKL